MQNYFLSLYSIPWEPAEVVIKLLDLCGDWDPNLPSAIEAHIGGENVMYTPLSSCCKKVGYKCN